MQRVKWIENLNVSGFGTQGIVGAGVCIHTYTASSPQAGCPANRDRIFGKQFVDQVKAMGIKQVLSAPRAPWQRAYVERLIGTIRRECLDHMIVVSQRCLYRHLKSFTDYYHRSRTHLALGKDSPVPRPIQLRDAGRIISIAQVGGLHHRYERRAA